MATHSCVASGRRLNEPAPSSSKPDRCTALQATETRTFGRSTGIDRLPDHAGRTLPAGRSSAGQNRASPSPSAGRAAAPWSELATGIALPSSWRGKHSSGAPRSLDAAGHPRSCERGSWPPRTPIAPHFAHVYAMQPSAVFMITGHCQSWGRLFASAWSSRAKLCLLRGVHHVPGLGSSR